MATILTRLLCSLASLISLVGCSTTSDGADSRGNASTDLAAPDASTVEDLPSFAPDVIRDLLETDSSSGMIATGGTPTTGGTIPTGGNGGTGGLAATGGTAATGGIIATGGAIPSGADSGIGGAGNECTPKVATMVSAGLDRTCAVLRGGTIQCWGSNKNGELGGGTTTDSSLPVTVSGITDAIAVSSNGYYHSCAVLNGGSVKCWGDNVAGQLGNGVAIGYTTTDSSVPVAVLGITDAVGISTGFDHSCAVLGNGTVQCWGLNSSGQLGDGTTTTSSVPVTVSSITNAIGVAASYAHSCAVLRDGSIRCWGLNEHGALGNGTTTNSALPVTVTGITNAVAVAAGQSYNCAVLSGGLVQCWGDNSSGELGNGTTTDSSFPVTVSGVTNAIALSAGLLHACAVLSDGSGKCWGYNWYGQLADGTYVGSSVPVRTSAIPSTVALSAGHSHTCAVSADGSLRCLGLNDHGQLGNGYTFLATAKPVTVQGFSCTGGTGSGGVPSTGGSTGAHREITLPPHCR